MSSDTLETLLNYKNELKKYKQVSILLKYFNTQDDDRIIQIIKSITKVKVTANEIKVNLIILFVYIQEFKIGGYLKKLRESKDKKIKDATEKLIKKYKKILHKPKRKKKSLKKNEPLVNFDEFLLPENIKTTNRNNFRKYLYEYLEPSLRDKEDKESYNKLMKTIIEIEEKLFGHFKTLKNYTHRTIEILYNLNQKQNETFRKKIISGEIKPEDLCEIDDINILIDGKQNETRKKKINEIKSDSQKKRGDITDDVFKCKGCDGKKTDKKKQ